MSDNTAIAWSFHYEGPIQPTSVRKCPMCIAVADKQCPREGHEHGSVQHCTSCAAAKNGFCPNHCGLAEALARHPEPQGFTAEHSRSFDVFAKGLLAQVSAFPADANGVYVHAVGHENQPAAPLAVVETELRASR